MPSAVRQRHPRSVRIPLAERIALGALSVAALLAALLVVGSVGAAALGR